MENFKRRPFVFICCPITPRSVDKNHAIEFLDNIREGIKIATKLVRAGFAVYCPGTDFCYWLVGEEQPSAEDIYEQDLSIIGRVDALFRVPGWDRSSNCMREVQEAIGLLIPTFGNLETIIHWKKEVWDARV